MVELQFKRFYETYKLTSFLLTVGLIYPNPKTDLWRLAAIPLMVGTTAPVVSVILIDMYRCWVERNIVRMITHSTVVGPFLGGLFKMILMYHKRVQAAQIIEEMDRDFIMLNKMAPEYKDIAAATVKNSQTYTEKSWTILITCCVMIFPVMAIGLTTYSFLFQSDATKYLIHDVRRPFSVTEVFESPYFEIIFGYEFYCSLLYVINFTAYDGFFGLTINHACMKMELFCKMMDNAMKGTKEEIHGLVVDVIQEQLRMFDFVDLIQDTFNIWLGMIFIATMLQICTCMYQVTEGYGFDLRYMIFIIGSIAHIYVPCRYGAKFKSVTATRFYCCGWERRRELNIKKMVLFMIARAQLPNEITAFNMLCFDMELFLSIMQTSYSMFTLLRS